MNALGGGGDVSGLWFVTGTALSSGDDRLELGGVRSGGVAGGIAEDGLVTVQVAFVDTVLLFGIMFSSDELDFHVGDKYGEVGVVVLLTVTGSKDEEDSFCVGVAGGEGVGDGVLLRERRGKGKS